MKTKWRVLFAACAWLVACEGSKGECLGHHVPWECCAGVAHDSIHLVEEIETKPGGLLLVPLERVVEFLASRRKELDVHERRYFAMTSA
jgi:hypothetical protein